MELHKVGLLILQPTPFCNINCTYCYLPERDVKSKMPIEMVSEVLQNLKESKLLYSEFQLVWHSGEPLTMPFEFYNQSFKIITDFASENDIKITIGIQTNGILLNKNFCELFSKYSHQLSLGLSIDGPEFIHDKYRLTKKNSGTHKIVSEKIKLLQEHEIGFNVICVLTVFSLDYPDEIFFYFHNLGIKKLAFNIDEVEGVNKNSSFTKHNEFITEKFISFMQRMYELQSQYKSFVIREFERLSISILTNTFINAGLVRVGSIISVDHNGNFSTFSPELLGMKDNRFGDFIFGNIREGLISDIIHNPKLKLIHKEITDGVNQCKSDCDYFSFCGGVDPSGKLYENGSFNSTETSYCYYMKQVLSEIVVNNLKTKLVNTDEII